MYNTTIAFMGKMILQDSFGIKLKFKILNYKIEQFEAPSFFAYNSDTYRLVVHLIFQIRSY